MSYSVLQSTATNTGDTYCGPSMKWSVQNIVLCWKIAPESEGCSKSLATWQVWSADIIILDSYYYSLNHSDPPQQSHWGRMKTSDVNSVLQGQEVSYQILPFALHNRIVLLKKTALSKLPSFLHNNPLYPHDALKHYLASLKNDLDSWNLGFLERKLSWNCFKNNSIFFHLSPTLSHFHPLQVENCDSNSRRVVDEDDNGKFRLQRVNR